MSGKTKKQRGGRTMQELISAPWLSPVEVARLLGVSTMSVRRLLWSHQIAAVRVSSCMRISREVLNSYLAARSLAPAPAASDRTRPTGRPRKPIKEPAVAAATSTTTPGAAEEVRAEGAQ